ncbi:MAG: GDP-L-fucose synthase [Myxococcota bacterium]|jgi:GDP-L-fucose synthase|nr:GDP-L-fucose synthase [Myxococcota bacterium]
MEQNAKIYVAGHRGLVGSAIERRVRRDYPNIVTSDVADFDLTDPRATDAFFAREKPVYVFLAAAKVGGIKANDTYPADFIRINLQIQTNVIDASYRHGVQKLLFLGSSCIYPKHCDQPMREEHLLTGKLEPTNDAYAIAKIAGILMCKAYNRQHGTSFVAAMPTNLYGPGDNFDLESSHVVPAMMRKLHEAKVAGAPSVELWGTGTPQRELLFVEDLADALVFVMNHFEASLDREDEKMFLNIGTGVDVRIRELAQLVQQTVGYQGSIAWNPAMPDGTPRKLLDVSRLAALGWKAPTSLENGLKKTYAWFLENEGTLRR